ncbi:hypothetical protein ACP70R_020987 [Stipagrostis hirtigluma subsp. patula]
MVDGRRTGPFQRRVKVAAAVGEAHVLERRRRGTTAKQRAAAWAGPHHQGGDGAVRARMGRQPKRRLVGTAATVACIDGGAVPLPGAEPRPGRGRIVMAATMRPGRQGARANRRPKPWRRAAAAGLESRGASLKHRAASWAAVDLQCGGCTAKAPPVRHQLQRRRAKTFAATGGDGHQRTLHHQTRHHKFINFFLRFIGFRSNQVTLCRLEFFGERTMVPGFLKHLAYVPPILVPLNTYCRGMQVIEMITPAGAVRDPGTSASQIMPLPWEGRLEVRAQAITRRVLEVFRDLFQEGLCLSIVDNNTFLVDELTGRPLLSAKAHQEIVWLVSEQQVDHNMKQLADVLHECLFIQNGIPVESVREVSDGLFPMMRHEGNKMWFAILNHSALVPMENFLDYYLRMYLFLEDIVAPLYPHEYKKVLEQLVFPTNWHDIVQKNRFMNFIYCGGVYNATDLAHEKQAEQVSRYLRNLAVHGLLPAVQKPGNFTLIGRTDVGRMFYFLAPVLVQKMQRALQLLEWLVCTTIDFLFVYNCV